MSLVPLRVIGEGVGFKDWVLLCLQSEVLTSPSRCLLFCNVHGPSSRAGSTEQTHRCSPDRPVYDSWKEKSLLPEVVASESLGSWQQRFLFCFVCVVLFFK